MFRSIKARRELITPIVISLFVFVGLFYFRGQIHSDFIAKNVNNSMIDIGIGFTGFVLTAYTLFLGFLPYLSVKVKSTAILDKVEFRFRFTIYSSIFLLFLSVCFLFYDVFWLSSIILGLLTFNLLMMFRLVQYLKLLFDDVRKN